MSEKSLPQLPDDLSALAARLRGLRPSASVTQMPAALAQAPRDRLMYRAGWAACETAHGWQVDSTDSSGDCIDHALPDVTEPRRVSGRTLASRAWAIATAALLLISLTLGGMLIERRDDSPPVATIDPSSNPKPLAPSPQPLNSFPIPHSPFPIAESPAPSPQPPASLLAPRSSIPPSPDNYLSLRTSVLLTGVEASAYRLPRPMAAETAHDALKRPQQPTDYRSVLNSLLGG